MQDEHRPGPRRQAIDRRFEVEPDVPAAGGGRRARHAAEGVVAIGEEALALGAEGAKAFDDDVHGHPVQPGGQRRLAAEAAELLPGPDEDVLGQLFGVGGAGHTTGEGEDARHVDAIEALEGRRVARDRACDIVGLRLGPGVSCAVHTAVQARRLRYPIGWRDPPEGWNPGYWPVFGREKSTLGASRASGGASNSG